MNPEDRMRDLMRGADASERPSEAEWEAFVGRAHRSLTVHRALSVAAVVVVLALGAIGGRAIVNATRSDDGKLAPVNSPTETDDAVVPGPTETEGSPAPQETETPAPAEITIEQWVVTKDGYLWLLHEQIPRTQAIGAAAMESLVAKNGAWGAQEGGRRLTSAIPTGTDLLGLTIKDGIATVDLSSEFAGPGGSLEERLRLAQVVYTLTQFPTVSGVEFKIEGDVVEAFGSHGLLIDEPQKRKDYQDLVAPIVVESPYPGEVVDTTFTVTGTANVFEANVSYRILDGDGVEVDYRALDEDGNEVDPGFTTATCGTGCRGRYSFTIDLVQELDSVIIEVFQASAEDGSPMDVVRVPVRIRL